MRTKETPAQKTWKLHAEIREDMKYGLDRFIADFVRDEEKDNIVFVARFRTIITHRILDELLRRYVIRRRPVK